MSRSKFDPQKRHRHSIRLPNHDYSQPGAYFITIVTWHRKCLFGEVVNGVMRLNDLGKIVQWEWLGLPKRFCFLELGTFVVMPNHFHGIPIFHANVGATRTDLTNAHAGKVLVPHMTLKGVDGSPLPRGRGKPIEHQAVGATRQGLSESTFSKLDGSLLPHGPQPTSLGMIMAQFKSRVTKRLWKIPSLKGTPIWQRNYYEHIIRNDRDLQSKTNYIEANPGLWEKDEENPLNIKS